VEQDTLRILIFGAHPDDADIRAGGVAARYAQLGHKVRMIAVTNGDAGHHQIGGAPLAWRRRKEAQAAADVLGVEYLVLDNHDGELMPTLENRREIIRQIRAFAPDLVMSPRPYDYHPDHRATAELVRDALYLVTVPNVVSDTPHLRQMPVAVYVMDGFQRPYPFRPDVVVDIGEVVEQKLNALVCHESQFFEWLPYNRRAGDEVPADPKARKAWLWEWLRPRFQRPATLYREQLAARYGARRAQRIEYAEAFEGGEYGAPLTEENIPRLFPFFPAAGTREA
jgi:LmbE family N-acetylglucosaminyl deacetylase